MQGIYESQITLHILLRDFLQMLQKPEVIY